MSARSLRTLLSAAALSLCATALVAADAVTPRAIAKPNTLNPPAILALDALVAGGRAQSVAVIVKANGTEIFRETYDVSAASARAALELRLEGARTSELLTIEHQQPGAIRFDLAVDGTVVRTIGIRELLDGARAANGREVVAVRPQVTINRANAAEHVEGNVQKPAPNAIQSTVRTVQRDATPGKLRAANDSTFVCPSGQSGLCDEEYQQCYNSCDPGDPGYYELCLSNCSSYYDWCYYGQTNIQEEEYFQPLYYIGSQGGFYPWYQFWDIHIWQYWAGNKVYRKWETHHCMYDGSYGPYLVVNQQTPEYCWTETSQSTDQGSYMDDCRF